VPAGAGGFGEPGGDELAIAPAPPPTFPVHLGDVAPAFCGAWCEAGDSANGDREKVAGWQRKVLGRVAPTIGGRISGGGETQWITMKALLCLPVPF
jgi:hypothetical protein